MNLKPADLFIGLLDFFSILLPGAALTYLFDGELQRLLLPNHLPLVDQGQSQADAGEPRSYAGSPPH